MKIITNNQPRPLLSWWDLTEKEQAEFNWLETGEDRYSAVFFRYKGQVYCLDEFVRINTDEALSGWDGVHATSAFSAVIIKYIHDLDDEIVVGYCYN